MLFSIGGVSPRIDHSSIIAPTAVISGDVEIGQNVVVSFGATIMGDDGPVVIGPGSVIRENVVIRADARHEVLIGSNVLVGAHSALYGCVIDDEAFVATASTILHGARIGTHAEVRIGGVVHANSTLPAESVLPIGWVAVGSPAQMLPPTAHDEISSIQHGLDFPRAAYGVERDHDGGVDMSVVTQNAIVAARRAGWVQLEAE